MIQPRPAHYAFAHRVLAETAHRQPHWLFEALEGAQATPTLAAEWTRAGGTPLDAQGLMVAGAHLVGSWRTLAVAMPEPIAPSEAHLVIMALHREHGSLRYFVVEKALSGIHEPARAYLAEWRANASRVRLLDLPQLSMDAALRCVAEELLTQLPALAPPGLQVMAPSVAPTALPTRTQPPSKPSRTGLWVTLGAVAFVVTAVGAYIGYDQWRRAEWRERQEERDAAAAKAKGALDAVKARVEKRRAELAEPRQRCLTHERERAKKALDQARQGRALDIAVKRPRDAAELVGAIAYRLPTDEQPARHAIEDADGSWIPAHPWIARHTTTCASLGEAYDALGVELAKPEPSKWASDYAEQLSQHKAKLEALEKGLDAAPAANGAEPTSLVVVDNSCTSQAVATFNNYSSGGVDRLELKSYDCNAMLVWISLDEGAPLAALRASGRALPERDPGVSTTTTELRRLNDACYARARAQASENLRQQLLAWD